MRLVLPRLRDEVFAWLDANEIAAEGMPFLRYRIINLERHWLRIEVGVPVVVGLKTMIAFNPIRFHQACTPQRFLSGTLEV
jgi:hypothetical protein